LLLATKDATGLSKVSRTPDVPTVCAIVRDIGCEPPEPADVEVLKEQIAEEMDVQDVVSQLTD